jgi:hypothetical protein
VPTFTASTTRGARRQRSQPGRSRDNDTEGAAGQARPTPFLAFSGFVRRFRLEAGGLVDPAPRRRRRRRSRRFAGGSFASAGPAQPVNEGPGVLLRGRSLVDATGPSRRSCLDRPSKSIITHGGERNTRCPKPPGQRSRYRRVQSELNPRLRRCRREKPPLLLAPTSASPRPIWYFILPSQGRLPTDEATKLRPITSSD